MAKQATRPKSALAKPKAGKNNSSRSRAAAAASPAFARGLKIRREMLGPQFAEAEIDPAGDFMWVLHEWVTTACFGAMWGRPALSPKIRSAITLAIMVAQGRPREVKMHVKAGLKNGLSKEEIAEVLLHSLVYCGVPRGSEAFRAADEMLRELGVVKA
jgi:4-carboxymuconolactone decarboxylase